MPELRDLMDGVAADLAAVRWPSGDELRRRVRRRRARTTAAVAGAVLTVSVGIAGLTGLRAESSPPSAGPSPSASAPSPSAPAEIPRSVLLRAAEVGRDLVSQDGPPEASTLVRVDELQFCRKARSPSQQPRFVIGVTHMMGPKENPPLMPFVLGQKVYRFGSADADGFMRDLRSAVTACGTQVTNGVDRNKKPVTVRYTWSIGDDRFTGDDAFVVRVDVVAHDAGTGRRLGQPSTTWVAYVRTGDLVTRVSAKKGTPWVLYRRGPPPGRPPRGRATAGHD
jgi:hypothetical protein